MSRTGRHPEHQIHKILADAGPHAAIALIRCNDPYTRQMIVAATADRANWRLGWPICR
jgi:hypothetical protein